MVFGGGSRRLEVLLELRDKFSAGMRGAGERVDSFTDTLKRHRTQLLAVTGALVGVAGVSVKAASDLGEAQNKANVTFGQAAGIIQDFAKTSADAFGISRKAANEYTATLGLILQTSGLSQKATADMSVELTKLAADLASFNNLPVDEALRKLQSGLVGQAEPLRTIGVLLSEAAVQAKAMEMGLGGASGELSEGAKVQARYQLILEQTRTAQGDFTRTSDELANSTRRMKAQLEDAAASLGTQLIPAATVAIGKISDLIKWFDQLSEPVKTALVVIGGLAAGVAALGLVLPPVVAGISALTGAIGVLVTVVAPVVAVIAAAAAAGWLLAASMEAASNAIQNLLHGTDLATNPLTIMKNELGFVKDAIADLIMPTTEQAQATRMSAEQLAAYEDAAAQAGISTTTYIREVRAGERPALNFAASTDAISQAMERATKALGGASEKVKLQTMDVGSLDQKLRELSETTRGTTFLQERIMALYEKSARHVSILAAQTSIAEESVWNIGRAAQAALGPLDELQAALARDADEVARMGREALLAMAALRTHPGTSGLPFAPTGVGGSSAFNIAPFPFQFRDIAPPGVPIAAGPPNINVTVHGSVTTPDLTAIIAREMREIERRGM